jgi:sugar/nucleoside kinase (ribokinase family)
MPSQKKFDVSVVGELNVDLVLYDLPGQFELDREYLASNMSVTLGSSSAIFAHNLSRMGNRVGFHSAIGDDAFGQMCLDRLVEAGVDVSAIKRFSGKQTGITVVLPQPEKRFILTYPGVMDEMRFEDLDLHRLTQAGHLHLSSYFLQKALRPRVAELFRYAKQAGLSTSLDTNDDPQDHWEPDFLEVFPSVDVLLPNEREAMRLAGIADPIRSLDFLAARVPLVVMKRGEQGAVAQRGNDRLDAMPPKVATVDTIGAGDSFDAGFLHQFIRGAKIEECLRFGNLAGALSTTRTGGTEAFRDAAYRNAFLAEGKSAVLPRVG